MSSRFITNYDINFNNKCDNCRKISFNDVSHHSRKGDCWVPINGIVYDITKYKKDLREKREEKERDRYELIETPSAEETKKHENNMKSIKNYKLNLTCGNKYENRNEDNIFIHSRSKNSQNNQNEIDINYKDYKVGEVKNYLLYKFLQILFIITLMISIVVLFYKKKNIYILIPLLILIIYGMYMYMSMYTEKNRVTKTIQNECCGGSKILNFDNPLRM